MIGPAAHVGPALDTLLRFHANYVEPTVKNVMDSAMVGALSIRRPETIGKVLTTTHLYEVGIGATMKYESAPPSPPPLYTHFFTSLPYKTSVVYVPN